LKEVGQKKDKGAGVFIWNIEWPEKRGNSEEKEHPSQVGHGETVVKKTVADRTKKKYHGIEGKKKTTTLIRVGE